MVRATWNGEVIAESDDTVVVEGNHYFPADAVRSDVLRPSATTSVCPWKGTASYHSLSVGGRGEPGCGLVLPFAEARSRADLGADRLLEGCEDRRLCVVAAA